MRIVLIFIIFCVFCFGNVLTPQQAFKFTQGSDFQGVFVRIDLSDGIFLYKKQLKVLLNGTNISENLNLPQTVIKDGEEVFYKSLQLDLPKILLENLNINKAKLEILYQGCADSGFCYRPMRANFELKKIDKSYEISTLSEKNANSNELSRYLEESHLFIILAVFFVYGLLLSLTPCTLPMIPILSSLILAQNTTNTSKKRAFLLSLTYVFFMSLAYAIAGVITAGLGASVQGLLQKPFVVGIFALILVFLALACFGVFEFSLPNRFAKINFAKKGVFTVAIMGFLSAFIVGPCVAAPLVAALLYIANSGDFVLGGLCLFVLSFGMGIPLLFVGLGLGYIKAGAWMVQINQLFGFMMLAVALWLVSRFILDSYMLVIYGIFGVFFAVFMGLFQGANSNLALIKKALLILVFAYSLALFLGGLGGGKSLLNPLNLSTQSNQKALSFELKNDLNSIQKTIKQNDKVMLDFTASWCENCKLLDSLTFSDERVQERLKEFKLIKTDISDNAEEELKIMKEFGVFAPPVLIFYEKGVENLRLIGFVSADEFLQKLP